MPKSTKEPLIKFAVSGFGQFPLDQLRYECCFPASEADSAQIERTFRRRGDSTEKHTVFLKRMREYRPTTTGRWNSFGWTVLADGDFEVMKLQDELRKEREV